MNTSRLAEVLQVRPYDGSSEYLRRPMRFVEVTEPEHQRVIDDAVAYIKAAHRQGATDCRDYYRSDSFATNAIPYEFLRDIADDRELAIALTIFSDAKEAGGSHWAPTNAEARALMYTRTRETAQYLRLLLAEQLTLSVH